MSLAILEAKKARVAGDYAIGAVIVKNNEVVVSAHNRVKLDQDPTSHAEVVAIRKATKLLGSRHLDDCILYTTHEPCPMCTTTAILAKMKGIVAGAQMEDMSAYRKQNHSEEWLWRTISIPTMDLIRNGTPKLQFVNGFMRNDCIKLFHS